MSVRSLSIALVLGVVSCVGDSTSPTDSGTEATTDAGTDAAKTCDPTKPFGAPTPLAGFATPAIEGGARLSPDELTLYLSASGGPLGDGSTAFDLYQASRAKISDAFGLPTRLAISTTVDDFAPAASNDGLTLFFESDVGGVSRLWFATRASTLADFSGAAAMSTPPAATGATASDGQPFVTSDGAELWFVSNRAGSQGLDIYMAPKSGASFGTAALQSTLSSPATDYYPTLSADRLTIYIASDRTGAGTSGGVDIWVSHRASTQDPFPAPTVVPELNTPQNDNPSWLSSDNCRLYMFSDHAGTADIYVAERKP